MKDKLLTGSLTLNFSSKRTDDLDLDEYGLDAEKRETVIATGGATEVKISVRVGDLTNEDMFPDNPEDFLNNGPVMALIEQIVKGLQSARGCSIESAAEAAMDKAESAREMMIRENILEALEGIACESMETQGNC